MQPKNTMLPVAQFVKRSRVIHVLIVVALIACGLRLFYVQVLHYGHYRKIALQDQLKQYAVPATRGLVYIHDGDTTVPIVLNQKLYVLYADPTLVKDQDKVARAITGVIGGDTNRYSRLLKQKDTRYVILGKKLTDDQSKRILKHKFPGVGTQAHSYRTYPQGALAAQTLGFVNDEGQGKYGIEQALNSTLKGVPGQLKAVTDVNGIPLASDKNNISVHPKNGADVVLTLDIGIQKQTERIVQEQAKKTKSKLLSAVIMDPNTGAIKAMANYPTYDPSNYQNVDDPNLFQNAVVSNAIEPGSTMKPLTAAAALDQGVIKANTKFYDPAQWVVDGFKIKNIEEDGGAREQSVATTLNLSLNTGVTWMLMQMGGGDINQKARSAWHNYLVNHYGFGKPTGVEQGYELGGIVPDPEDNGAGIDLTYANTTFGQAMQATALQMAGALSSVVNGGVYYQPYLVDQTVREGKTETTKPEVIRNNVVSAKVSEDMIPLLEYIVREHYVAGARYLNFGNNYIVGGKTGTAEIAQPTGGYYKDKFNGTYVGFVGGNKPQYVLAIFNHEPHVPGYAGSNAGQPVFAELAHMLINSGRVTPKR